MAGQTLAQLVHGLRPAARERACAGCLPLRRRETGRGTHGTGSAGRGPPRRGTRPPEDGAQRPTDLRAGAALRGGDGPGREGRVVGPARGATARQDEALRGDHRSEGGRSVAPAVGRLLRNASRTLCAPSCTAGVRAPRRVGHGGVGRHRPRGGRVALHGDEDRHAARRAPGASGGGESFARPIL